VKCFPRRDRKATNSATSSALSDKLSIPALVTGGEKANGEVFGQQIKVVVSDATVVIVKNTRR
jgi:hypothetical protein